MMKMDKYLEAIRRIRALARLADEVSAKAETEQFGGGNHIFQFDTATTRQTQDESQRLVAVGP